MALPPAESPSTRNSSAIDGSWLVQSASLPGSAGPATTRLRTICFAVFKRRCAFSMANAAIWSPVSGCWLSHSAKWSFTTPCTKLAHSRDDSRSLVCPENCGSWIFTDSTKLTPSHTSSGASLSPRGTRFLNSQNSRTASVTPERRPLTCVPPSVVGIRFT